MNALTLGSRQRPAAGSDEPKTEQPLDAAWIVLEAANDLGDHATVEICRRVIDANLNGRPAAESDIYVIVEYFR